MSRFVITDPSNQTQIFEISGSTVSIGRADSNDLVLPHPSVSRSHARVTALPGDTVLIIDLGSMNGTFVNGHPIQEQRLADQDRINIGAFELKFDAATRAPFYVEAGRDAGRDITGLIGDDALSVGLHQEPEPVAPPQTSIQDRLAALEKENKLLKLLLAVGKTLSSTMTPQEVMQQVMELVFQMENVERGFVMLHDERRGFLPAIMLYKDEHQRADPYGPVLSKTVIDQVMTERVPVLIRDVSRDQRFSTSESLRISGIRSAMCAPLIYKDRIFGFFYVDCLSKPYAFSKEELDIFSVVAAEAAISYDRAHSHAELSRRAIERQALERFMSSVVVEKILASPDEIRLGGENQTATILFADIRGFTRLSEGLPPQKVVELLNEYFSEMTDLIFDNGGTLDKYLGDGIMALFGAPWPKPDDAQRAVRTAGAMQRALVALNRQWQARGQEPLQMGVGINTGQVTAGNIGSSKRMDYTVIGDAVNLASRLCAHAAGGQVLISESTFREIGSPALRLESIKVKGKAAPVEVFEVLWKDSVSS
ncbi:MAG: adenylate/guanylate cyclase domain-containing protein [Terriglobia bacterium]|jgi:adenylate cyclase